MVYGEHVLAEPPKLHAVQPASFSFAERLDGRLLGVLGNYAFDAIMGPDRDAGEEIGRHRHAGCDFHINQLRIHQPLPDAGIVLRPCQLESIFAVGSGLAGGRQSDACARLAPTATSGLHSFTHGHGMDIGAERGTLPFRRRHVVPILQVGIALGRHHQVRSNAVGAHPEQKRAVPGDEAVLQNRSSGRLLGIEAGVHGQGKRQIPDLDRIAGHVAERDRPTEDAALRLEANSDGQRLAAIVLRAIIAGSNLR